MDIYAQLADRIIKAQEEIIGPIAWEQALRVPGIKKDPATQMPLIVSTKIEEKKEILAKLVKQYEYLFGQTSVEVCKEAIRPIINQEPNVQLPQILL